MNRILIVDIETMHGGDPTETLAPFLPSVKGGRSENPVAQAREAEVNRQKAIGKALLSPVSARLLCIGATEIIEAPKWRLSGEVAPKMEDEINHHFFLSYPSEDEANVIFQLKELIHPNTFFVTFNGRSFDFPFLMFRAAIHGIPLYLPSYKYNGRDNHFDLFVHLNEISNLEQLYTNWKMIGLKKWIQYFGFTHEKKSIATGEINLEQLYKDGKSDEIEEYQMNDILNIIELWNIFKNNVNWDFRGSGRFSSTE